MSSTSTYGNLEETTQLATLFLAIAIPALILFVIFLALYISRSNCSNGNAFPISVGVSVGHELQNGGATTVPKINCEFASISLCRETEKYDVQFRDKDDQVFKTETIDARKFPGRLTYFVTAEQPSGITDPELELSVRLRAFKHFSDQNPGHQTDWLRPTDDRGTYRQPCTGDVANCTLPFACDPLSNHCERVQKD